MTKIVTGSGDFINHGYKFTMPSLEFDHIILPHERGASFYQNVLPSYAVVI